MSIEALGLGATPLAVDGARKRAVQPLTEGSFASELSAVVGETNEALNKAEAAARDLAQGKGDVVESMIALGRADISLRMVVNLRNKMLESYQDIMRLQV